jgi:hypothetical protein
VVYAHIRRVRVHALIGLRSLDVIEHFAPALAGGRKGFKPPLTVAFCRCMVFWEGGTPHRVVRALTTDADLAHLGGRRTPRARTCARRGEAPLPLLGSKVRPPRLLLHVPAFGVNVGDRIPSAPNR